jgi:hypothetical protein
MIVEDCTILLQGRINAETFNLWIKNHKDSNVVVSIWEDEDLTLFKIPKKWKVVINKYPLIRGWRYSNLDYQIITTLSGLNEVITRYVIKARCDEYWSNIHKVLNLIKEDEEKIVSSSMYFRSKNYDASGKMKFHIGDKILGGTTDNLILMFESTIHNIELNLWETKNPEGQLGLGYVIAKDKDFDINSFLSYFKNIRNRDVNEDILNNNLINGLPTINQRCMEISLNYFYKGKINWNDLEKDFKYIWDVSNEILNMVRNYNQPKVEFDDMKYLKRWFKIIDINELKPYIATFSGGSESTRKWFRDNFDNKKEDCLTDINLSI